jgi:hypothetical protein
MHRIRKEPEMNFYKVTAHGKYDIAYAGGLSNKISTFEIEANTKKDAISQARRMLKQDMPDARQNYGAITFKVKEY